MFVGSVGAVSFSVDTDSEWDQGSNSNLRIQNGDLLLDLKYVDGSTKVGYVTSSGKVSFVDADTKEELKFELDNVQNLADIADIGNDGDKDIIYRSSGNIKYYDMGSNTVTDTLVSVSEGSIGGAADIGEDGDIDITYVSGGDLKSYDFGSQTTTTLVDDTGGDIKSASYPADVDDDGVLDIPFIEYNALHYYDTSSAPPVSTGDTVQIDSSTGVDDLGGSGDIGSDGVFDVVGNDADYTKVSDGTYVDANSEGSDNSHIGNLIDYDADGSLEVPYIGFDGVGYFDYGLDSWVDLEVSDESNTDDPVFMDLDYFSEGNYTSQSFQAGQAASWENITLNSINRSNGGEIKVKVEVSSDDFSTVTDEQTLTNSEIQDGTKTYQLDNISTKTDYVRVSVDYLSGSTPTLAGYTVNGNENTKPTIDSVGFNKSNPVYGDSLFANASVSDEDGVSEVRFTVWERGTKIIDNQTGTQAGTGFWHSSDFNIDEGPGHYNASVTYAEDSTGKSNTSDIQSSFYVENAPPRFNGSKINDDRKLNDLNYTLYIDDRGQTDIASYSGSGTLVDFSNQSLILDKLMPISDTYTVEDNYTASDSVAVDIFKSESSLRADDGTHNLSYQEVNKSITVTNNMGLWVDYSLEWISYGNEVAGETWSSNISTSSSASHTGVWSGDWLKETEYGFSVPSQVYIGDNYTGGRPVEIVEQKGVAWSNVDTSGRVSDPVDCSQSNGTSLDVGSSSTKNYTIGFSCDPGSIDSTSLTVNNLSTGERVWYNGSFTVNNNLTDESTYVWKVDESNLKNPDNRDGGSLEGYADGNQVNITTVDQGSEIWLYIGKEHTNSSWHTGSHPASVTYTLGASDGSGGGSGGGGGGGGTGTDDELSVVFKETLLKVFPGTRAKKQFTLENRENRRGNVTLNVPAGGQCQHFSLTEDWERSRTVRIGAATNVFSNSNNVDVWVDMPAEAELSGFDNNSISCQLQARSDLGGTGELVLEARPASNPLQALVEGFELKDLTFTVLENKGLTVVLVLFVSAVSPFAIRRVL